MKILQLSFLLLALSARGFIHAGSDSTLVRLGAFVKNIQAFNLLYQQEKVYLHFDNTGYFLGESIWFKAYVTAASDLIATPMSRVLHVELLDMEGNIVNTQKLRIAGGQAEGSIPLTRMAMKSGFYEVRAYTRLMLNWEAESLFSRVFPVFETPAREGDYARKEIRLRPSSYKIPQNRAEAPSGKKLNVDFYPEGGQLVHGITSTVAFKVTDEEGRTLEATGCVLNAQGDTVSVFSTVHEGMGSFSYMPDGDKSKIRIRARDEVKGSSYTLPAAGQTGCILQVQNLHPEQVRVRVSATPGYASTPLGLTVMCRGKLSFLKILESVPEAGYSFAIPKAQLAAGVNQITLFTDEGKVLAERLLYIRGNDPFLKMEFSRDKHEYAPFEEVRMEVSVQDTAGRPVETTLSLAVRDGDTEIPSSYEETIHTNMLLSSDLKGYISNPGYYFESTDRMHHIALDLLMLTQGYRRYPWTQMAGVTAFEPVHKIEKGILIDGSVKSVTRKKLQENVDVKMIMYSDSAFQEATCPTDNEGTFNYMASDFFGSWKLQMETKKDNKRKEYWITLDRVFSPQPRFYSFYDTHIPSMRASKDKRNFLLKEGDAATDNEIPSDDPVETEVPEGAKTLKEVIVKGQKARNSFINKGVNLVYDVVQEEAKLEDQATGYNEMIFEFLARINKYFNYDVGGPVTYKGRKVFFTLDTGTGTRNSLFDGSEQIINMNESSAITQSLTNPISGETSATDGTGGENTGIDESSVEDRTKKIDFSMYSSSDIQSIAIIEEPSVYKTILPKLYEEKEIREGKMVVLIVLKLHPRKVKTPAGIRMTSLQGFSLPRVFYSPNYKEYQLPKEEDFRRTLYWNPNVKTNPQGKGEVSFHNNGSCKRIIVSAETITPEGIPGVYYEE